jgi:hypothetical protein
MNRLHQSYFELWSALNRPSLVTGHGPKQLVKVLSKFRWIQLRGSNLDITDTFDLPATPAREYSSKGVETAFGT